MVNIYWYDFKIKIHQLVGQVVFDAIGKRPTTVGGNSSGSKFSIGFDVDLTGAEKLAVKAAMPAFVFKFYDVNTKARIEVRNEP